MTESKRTKYYWAQQLSAAIGLLLSVYLLVQHTRLKSGIQDTASFCSLSKFVDCDVVNGSQFSEIAGIPLAAIGCVYFFVLLLLGFLSPLKDKSFTSSQTLMAWLAAVGLTLELLPFLIWQVFFLKAICIVCLATYVCTFVHWFCNVSLMEARPANFFAGFVQTLRRPLVVNKTIYPKQKITLGLIALVCFVCVVALLPYFVKSGASRYTGVDEEIQRFYAQWKEKPARTIETIPQNGTLGNPDAKVKIIIFSDFECPFCKKAAFTLHAALRPYLNRVHLTFRNYPLDASCNPSMTYQLHAFACRLARLSFCAKEKNQFWEFHDHVFLKMNENKFKEGSDAVYGDLKEFFTPDEIQACLKSEKSLSYVQSDIAAGNKLEIKGTPAVFVNGKFVAIPITMESLRKLIELEEKTAR